MKKAVEALRHELVGIRTGRAAPSLVEQLEVDAYGSPMPLIQLAQINAPEPRLIQIQPYDRNLIKAIEKAIQGSDLALTPGNDGTVIRLPIPALTEERRRELVRVVRNMVEHGRVAVRNVRHHTNDKLKLMEKNGEITEDDHKRHAKKVQDLTDGYIKKLDDLLKGKEAEVMEV